MGEGKNQNISSATYAVMHQRERATGTRMQLSLHQLE